jgi:hypothetical protein
MKIKLKNIYLISKEEIYKNKKTISRKTIVFSVLILAVYSLLFFFSMTTDIASDNSVYNVATNSEEIRSVLNTNDKLAVEIIDPEDYENREYDSGLFLVQGPGELIPEESLLLMSSRRGYRGRLKRDAAVKNIIDAVSEYNYNLYIYEYNKNDDLFYDLFPVWVMLLDRNEIISDQERFYEEFNTTLEQQSGAENRMQQDINEFRRGISAGEDYDFQKQVTDLLFQSNYEDMTTPSNLVISLPLQSIVFGLLILTPLMFISTGYLSSLYNERIKNRSSVLFSCAITRGEIVIGKTLPYLIAALIVSAVLVFAVRPDIWGVLYAIPAILTSILGYFAVCFALVLLSRSYKEISFLKTSIASVYIGYLLLPTFFLSLHDAAFMSPISAVTEIMTSGELGFQLYAFSIIPIFLSSIILYYFFSKIFCEEGLLIDSIPKKLYFGLSRIVKNKRNIFLVSFMSFPVVVLIESVFLIFLLLPFDNPFWPMLALIAVAGVTEEIVKNISIYSAYRINKLKANPIVIGVVSGVGFALAEKAMLLVMLPELVSNYNIIVIPVLIVPFIFHSLTCAAFAALAKRTRMRFKSLILIPIAIHILYNIAVVALTASAGVSGR